MPEELGVKLESLGTQDDNPFNPPSGIGKMKMNEPLEIRIGDRTHGATLSECLGWAEEVRLKNEYITQLEAELVLVSAPTRKLLDELQAWEARAALFVDQGDEIERLRKERDALEQFAHAELQTLGDGRDYALAVYTLRDLPTTKDADLLDLAWALAQDGNVSRGDWDGFKRFWLEHILNVARKEIEDGL